MKHLFVLACLATSASLAVAENWPNWRGPLNNGVSAEKNLPADLGDPKNLAWKLVLPGMGGSTPVIWNDRIYFTCGDGKSLVLMCVKTDGKLLWKKEVASSNRVIRKDEGNEASASPVVDGKHVFAFLGTGDLACFDLDGKEIWKHNVQDKYGKFSIQHGMHSSPLLHGEHLFLNLLHGNAHWVLAFNKADGKEVWKYHRKTDAQSESKEAYTSPSLANNGKEDYLVVHGADYTTGHKLTNGEEIWRIEDLNPKAKYSGAFRIIASPVVADGLIVVPTARNTQIVAVKADVAGTIKMGSSSELWRKMAGAPDVPSPVIHEGLVYLCRENGFLLLLDAKSGDEIYHKRLHDSRHRASPVLADGKIYMVARDGTINVVKVGREFELLASSKIDDVFAASPAISNGRIYLRGFNALYAISVNGK